MAGKKSYAPPLWADRFLQWYCRSDRLEEIQGDAYELYCRTVKKKKKWLADIQFVWNVLRFFRWKNIKKRNNQVNSIPFGMIKNLLLVAFRNFLRQPGHSLLNVAGLAVSFLAAILILLWVGYEHSYNGFHDNPERIFKVMSHVETNGAMETYDAAEVQLDVSSIAEVEQKTVVLTGSRWPNELCFRPEGKTECVYLIGIYSDDVFFSVFNFPILTGDPDPLRGPTNIAISENMAQRLFAGENPIGRTFKIDDRHPVTVASVFRNVPSNSSLQFDFVLPLAFYKNMRGLNDQEFGTYFLSIYLKTSKEINGDELSRKLNRAPVLTDRLKNDHVSYSAFPITDWRLHGEFENGKSVGGRIQYINLFLLVAALVVIMAVINFINLTTARASTRSKEIGIRKVTGALRSGIVLQFIGESFVVVLISLGIACVAAQLLIQPFNALLGESLSITLLSPSTLVYVLTFLLVVALAAGTYPGWVMASFQPAKVLKGMLTTRSTGSQQLRKALLVIQVGTSVGIIIFTGILFQQLSFIQNQHLGFDRENIIRIEPSYRLLTHYQEFKNELLAHPEIKSIAASSGNPLSMSSHTTGVSWPGMPEGTRTTFQILGSTPELPETFGMTLVQGRLLTSTPTDTVNSEVLVTEEAVRVMNLSEPVGTRFTIGAVNCVIVGVLKDFHTESLRREKLPVVVYSHRTDQCTSLFVKYQRGATQKALSIIQKAYDQHEPAFTMKYTFEDDVFNNLYKTERTVSYMIIFFMIISFVIAIIGVVGLSTYNVLRRKKEIGIKRVFGASIAHVLAMLSREFVILIVLAALLGMPVAWYSAESWLTGFAYRIDMPWWIYGAAFTFVLMITLALIVAQALRTVRANPTQSLRSE